MLNTSIEMSISTSSLICKKLTDEYISSIISNVCEKENLNDQVNKFQAKLLKQSSFHLT